MILLTGRHEVQRGNSVSMRSFNQQFALPSGLDISGLATEVNSAGLLVISAPQTKDIEIAEKGDLESNKSTESRRVTSEAAFEVEGGVGSTKKVEDSSKKQEQKTVKRETEDGWEEEIIEEYEEEVTMSSSTTTTYSSDSAGGSMRIPMSLEGVAGGTQTVETASSNQNMKAKDGKVIGMQQSSEKASETKEMVIPIQIQGRPSIQQKPRTPRVRMLPFEFSALPMPSMDMPSLGMPSLGMPEFSMPMQSAGDMMADMQSQMQAQMAQMQQASMQQM